MTYAPRTVRLGGHLAATEGSGRGAGNAPEGPKAIRPAAEGCRRSPRHPGPWAALGAPDSAALPSPPGFTAHLGLPM